MGKTKIQWTEKTWNPIRGCSKVSAGCARCYAEKIAARFCAPAPYIGEMTSPDWDRKAGGPFHGFIDPSTRRWNGRVDLVESMLDGRGTPLRTRKPTTWFVNSMSDLFHENLLDADIYRVFAVMERCPQHTFQVLTKRAWRMLSTVKRIYGGANIGRVLPNVHLGVSVENQAAADERIPLLLQTPAAVRFISAEPLLGPVEIQRYLSRVTWRDTETGRGERPRLDWAIVGGESGPGARPCDVQWIRSIVRQCREARVSCFVKQLGAFPVVEACRQHHYDFGDAIGRKARFSAVDPLHPSSGMWRIHFDSSKGAEPAEWPKDLRVREMPEVAR